jgi:hypothetical protein
MEKIKVNAPEQYESFMITLNENKYPIAHQMKLEELMESGAFNSVEEAKEWINTTPIELELYYEKHSGLFAVEADAIENASESLCSPYTGVEFYDPELVDE